MIRLANAPVSFGVFEHTIGTVPNIPAPDEVLGAIAHAGYEGTELGPSGYLGDGDTVRARLARFDLDLAGAFIPIRLSEQEHWDDDLAAMESTLDVVAAAGSEATKVVLADARSGELSASARSDWTTEVGGASPTVSSEQRISPTAVASSRPSTTTRQRTSRRRGRSTASSS